MNYEKIIDKLSKIKRLADEGHKGEAVAARNRLYALLDKYSISMDDLKSLELELRHVRYGDDLDRKLIIQILASLNIQGYQVLSAGKSNRRLKQLAFDASNLDYVEFQNKLSFYRGALKRDMDVFYKAFVHSHRLYRDTKDDEGEAPPMEEQIRILKAMKGIGSSRYHKQLS